MAAHPSNRPVDQASKGPGPVLTPKWFVGTGRPTGAEKQSAARQGRGSIRPSPGQGKRGYDKAGSALRGRRNLPTRPPFPREGKGPGAEPLLEAHVQSEAESELAPRGTRWSRARATLPGHIRGSPRPNRRRALQRGPGDHLAWPCGVRRASLCGSERSGPCRPAP